MKQIKIKKRKRDENATDKEKKGEKKRWVGRATSVTRNVSVKRPKR
jgi:hypothetical protein